MKAYIAGPFFTEEERSLLNEMIGYVKQNYPYLELFIPMEHTITNGDLMDNNMWSKLVFNMDVEALKTSDIVFALYMGHYSDTGTAWELGYAYAKDIPVFLYIPNSKEVMSIMPIQGSELLNNIDKHKLIQK